MLNKSENNVDVMIDELFESSGSLLDRGKNKLIF